MGGNPFVKIVSAGRNNRETTLPTRGGDLKLACAKQVYEDRFSCENLYHTHIYIFTVICIPRRERERDVFFLFKNEVASTIRTEKWITPYASAEFAILTFVDFQVCTSMYGFIRTKLVLTGESWKYQLRNVRIDGWMLLIWWIEKESMSKFTYLYGLSWFDLFSFYFILICNW